MGRHFVRAVHRGIEQGCNHHNQPSNNRNGFDPGTGNHRNLDAEAQAPSTGLLKTGETLEAPSGLEPEPQV